MPALHTAQHDRQIAGTFRADLSHWSARVTVTLGVKLNIIIDVQASRAPRKQLIFD